MGAPRWSLLESSQRQDQPGWHLFLVRVAVSLANPPNWVVGMVAEGGQDQDEVRARWEDDVSEGSGQVSSVMVVLGLRPVSSLLRDEVMGLVGACQKETKQWMVVGGERGEECSTGAGSSQF